MSILVVDDSEDGRDIAEAMLLAGGYADVHTAGSAAEAFRFLGIGGAVSPESSPVDLVLLDIVMPEIDGIEACARIRNNSRHSDVPIIMVTALGDTDSLANAFIAGATDYITKPLNSVELTARVRSALRLKSELDRRKARERELLQVISNGSNRGTPHLIDDTTGLFLGEVAEIYLSADANFPADRDVSVLALSIDRLDAYRSTQGDAAALGLMARAAHAVKSTAANVGVVAAIYRNGAIVLVVPELGSKAAWKLAEALRESVAKLGIVNPESICADYVTASVALVTGYCNRRADRIHLLTQAISAVPGVAAAGGNRVVSAYA